MYITVEEYAEKEGISRQAVYKRIQKKKLKTKQDKVTGKMMIYIKPKSNIQQQVNTTTGKIEELYQNEINALKEIIKLKDEKILQLEKEIQELRQQHKKGFLDKIF